MRIRGCCARPVTHGFNKSEAHLTLGQVFICSPASEAMPAGRNEMVTSFDAIIVQAL